MTGAWRGGLCGTVGLDFAGHHGRGKCGSTTAIRRTVSQNITHSVPLGNVVGQCLVIASPSLLLCPGYICVDTVVEEKDPLIHAVFIYRRLVLIKLLELTV